MQSHDKQILKTFRIKYLHEGKMHNTISQHFSYFKAIDSVPTGATIIKFQRLSASMDTVH